MDSALESLDCPQFYDFTAPTPKMIKKKSMEDSVMSTATKRKHAEEPTTCSKKAKCSPTLAEKIYRMEHGTPKRFKEPAPKSTKKPTLTRPEPFNLHTSERAEMRPGHSSAAEPTEEYVPLSIQVARFSTLTPPRFKRIPTPCEPHTTLSLTKPQPFNLSTDTCRKAHPVRSRSMPSFKATPVNKKMLSSGGDLGVPKVAKKPCTVPEEFSLTKRMEPVRGQKWAPPAPTGPFKATPMPLSTPFKPVLPHRKVSSTPFTLRTDTRSRSATRHQVLHTKPEPETQQPFKATPWKAEDYAKPQSTPRGTKRPLTEIQAFTSHTDDRASKRACWETELKQKEAAKEEAMAQLEREKKEKEARNVRALRRSLVHKATPIKRFKDVAKTPKGAAKLSMEVSPAPEGQTLEVKQSQTASEASAEPSSIAADTAPATAPEVAVCSPVLAMR